MKGDRYERENENRDYRDWQHWLGSCAAYRDRLCACVFCQLRQRLRSSGVGYYYVMPQTVEEVPRDRDLLNIYPERQIVWVLVTASPALKRIWHQL